MEDTVKEVVQDNSKGNSQKSRPRKQQKNYFPNYKLLKENTKMTYALEYQPCFHHFHNKEIPLENQCCSNESCPCFLRGFCDKYCGCDLDLCKIRF